MVYRRREAPVLFFYTFVMSGCYVGAATNGLSVCERGREMGLPVCVWCSEVATKLATAYFFVTKKPIIEIFCVTLQFEIF